MDKGGVDNLKGAAIGNGCTGNKKGACTGDRAPYLADLYWGNGLYCSDVNECTVTVAEAAAITTTSRNNCPPNSACTNTDSSFTCACLPGFEATSTGGSGYYNSQTCVDIDECTENSHACHSTRATCANTIGSYTCSCNSPLFGGNGFECHAPPPARLGSS